MSSSRNDASLSDANEAKISNKATRRRTARRKPTLRSVVSTLTLVGLAGFAVAPVPYVVKQAGVTLDVLGTTDIDGKDTALISIAGAKTHDTTGQLHLTTVGVRGTPSHQLNAMGTLIGWLSPNAGVAPIESVFPPELTERQVEAQNTQDMVSSQQAAVVAALTGLGYEVPASIRIAGASTRQEMKIPTDDDAVRAVDVVQKDDVIASLNGVKATTYQGFFGEVAKVTPGAEVTLGVLRKGKLVTLKFSTVADPRDPKQTRLGIFVEPTFDPPVDVTISIDRVGGPSAGTMFALGIIDKLTDGNLTGGKTIAGTGTIDADGKVGPIGGIRYKLIGAKRDGATIFLAPQSNCDEVIGHVPDGMQVIAVGTLHEARKALLAAAQGNTTNLKSCSSAK